ncbi:hypothetical protein J5X92_01890 [Alteromonas sp. K632G]|uniref:hypothetical protein n=1 Tax=Alteromonas sp. K632G TaxID=2820757 RepID=UPI001AD6F309|nr:hypothetical protein [Alteromonas sp. K632G]MBO7920968.1 hypothetical protein [Alteromonas sp. K632G]
MSMFKRENRYVVFKRKNLSHAQGKVLHSVESELCPDGNVKECLVVEHDWPCYDAAWNMIVKLSEGKFSDPYAEIKQLRERVKELEQNLLPIENGKNRYGLDVSYFRNAINRELNRSLANHKPDELARVLARLSRTADESVMFEPEFSGNFAIEKKRIGYYASCIESGMNDGQASLLADIYAEQLRKGGES